jgi:hypothetical protein
MKLGMLAALGWLGVVGLIALVRCLRRTPQWRGIAEALDDERRIASVIIRQHDRQYGRRRTWIEVGRETAVRAFLLRLDDGGSLLVDGDQATPLVCALDAFGNDLVARHYGASRMAFTLLGGQTDYYSRTRSGRLLSGERVVVTGSFTAPTRQNSGPYRDGAGARRGRPTLIASAAVYDRLRRRQAKLLAAGAVLAAFLAAALPWVPRPRDADAAEGFLLAITGALALGHLYCVWRSRPWFSRKRFNQVDDSWIDELAT